MLPKCTAVANFFRGTENHTVMYFFLLGGPRGPICNQVRLFWRERATLLRTQFMQSNIASSDPAMDVCSGPDGVSESARPPPAQNDAEARPKEAARVGPARRVGAAVRLVLDGFQESARTLETPSESMEGVFSSVDGDGLASAQNEPQGGNMNKETQQIVHLRRDTSTMRGRF